MTRLASALTITAAASRKLILGVVASGAMGLGAPGAGGGTARGWGEGPPVGRILSVSWRMSLTFFSSVAQNLLSEVLRTVVLELLPPPVPPAAPPPPAPAVPPPVPICEETPTVPMARRSML